MKLQTITPKLQPNSNKNDQPQQPVQTSFKGLEALTAALNFLQTNQGVGASFVDAAFMCTPRTIVDFSRGPEAGVETARREFSSNINDSLLGAYGLGAAWLLSRKFNNTYGVEAHKMPVDKDRLDVLSEIRYKSGDINDAKNLDSYLEEALNKTKGFNPATSEWVGVDEEVKNLVKERIKKEVQEAVPGDKKAAKTKYKEAKKYIKSMLAKSTGAESDFKINESASALDDYIDDLFKVTKAFMSKKVVPLFNKEKLTNPDEIKKAIKENKFLKEFKTLKLGTAGLGIAACAAIGASVQPINMYLTKKKTGTTGFVGGGKKDDSAGFMMLKGIVAIAAGAAMFRTIGRYKTIPTKIQFKGIWPTIPQFKLVYAITIISRLLSARNDNELREATIKDSLGFANWLILGGFVSKLTAMALEKATKLKEGSIVDNKFIKYNEADNITHIPLINKDWKKPKWIGGSVVSREEVLYQAFKKAGLSTIKEGGKAKTFKEMLNEVEKLPGVKKKIALLALVQIAGYAWSALALGIGIPKLNIAITKSIEGKKKLNEAEQKAAA